MSAQHTPGLWRASPASAKGHVIGIYDDTGCIVASVRVAGPVAAARNKADASLIAAAPDLLAALRDLADNDWTYIGSEADTGNPKSLYSRVRRARAAIAKAGGSES